jgi:ribonuclease HI
MSVGSLDFQDFLPRQDDPVLTHVTTTSTHLPPPPPLHILPLPTPTTAPNTSPLSTTRTRVESTTHRTQPTTLRRSGRILSRDTQRAIIRHKNTERERERELLRVAQHELVEAQRFARKRRRLEKAHSKERARLRRAEAGRKRKQADDLARRLHLNPITNTLHRFLNPPTNPNRPSSIPTQVNRSGHSGPNNPPPLPPSPPSPPPPNPRHNVEPNPNPSLLPSPKIVTINVAGFSIDQTGAARGRFEKVVKLIKHLLTHNDIVIVQETHHRCDDSLFSLHTKFEGVHISGSPMHPDEGSGGVAIFSAQSIQSHYLIHPSTPPGGTGRIISNLYIPKVNSLTSHRPFQVTNFYLQSGTNPSSINKKIKQINLLAQLPTYPHTHEFMGGDRNFTIYPDDRSSHSPQQVGSPRVLAAWDLLQRTRNLQEIAQPTHTFYRRGEDNQGNVTVSSSKLDVFLTSYSPADSAILTPTSQVAPSVPYTITSYPRTGTATFTSLIPSRSDPSGHAAHITDHAPLRLTFTDPLTSHHTPGTTLPLWALQHHSFPQTFFSLAEDPTASPPASGGWNELARGNDLICKAAKAVVAAHRTEKITTKTGLLEIALRTYRTATNPLSTYQDIQNTANSGGQYPELQILLPHLDTPSRDTSALKTFIDKQIASIATNNTHTDGFTANERPLSQVERLAKAFPKLKARVGSLIEDGRAATTDPQGLTNITHRYWSKHWQSRPLSSRPSRLFRKYAKKITSPPLPITLDAITKIISNTTHSAAGPNNIPFVAYRRLVDFFAPIFLKLTTELMNGTPPPPSFNSGILHLIPKTGTGWIDDTRPIVVSNADNRIIANIIRWSISPSLAGIIDPAQQGFLPGRHMDTLLEFFNESFYKALEEDEGYSMLLFDFAKAFDSCHHSALFQLIKAVGLPETHINAIKGLFSNAHCLTNFKGAPPKQIFFHSGIKQGCPLSPLLFVLLMDVLHSMVKDSCPELDFKLYADDTAAGQADLHTFIPQLRTIFKKFERHTGLTLNLTKTILVSTLPPGRRGPLLTALAQANWTDVTVKESAPYLGLPIGRKVEVGDAFRGAITKFRRRIHRYHNQNLTLAKRILSVNVFLLPVFSFAHQFFNWPSNMKKAMLSDLDGYLRRFNSIKTDHLSTPTSHFGLPTPLKDLGLLNLATLAHKADPGDWLHPGTTWSMRIKVQRSIAIAFIAQNFHLNPVDFVGKPGSLIYKAIQDSEVYKIHWSNAYTNRKLDAWNTPIADRVHLKDNYNSLPKWVPAYAKTHFILTVYNALPSSRRLRYLWDRVTEDSPSPHIAPFLPCFLCGYGEDSAQHLYWECFVVRRSLSQLFDALGLPTTLDLPGHPTFRQTTTLEIPGLDTKIAGIICLLNFSTWNQRNCRARGSLSHHHQTIQTAIVNDTVDRLTKHAGSIMTDAQLPGNTLPAEVKSAAKKNTRSFGSSGSRSSEQSAAAKLMVESLLLSTNPDSVQLWTDGSSLGNPGPSGSGVFILRPDGSSTSISFFLGKSTNQVGELFAVLAGLQFIGPVARSADLNIYTDSKYTKNTGEGTWFPRKNTILASRLRAKLRSLSCNFNFIWVPAHSGVPQNETVDQLAKDGADFCAPFNHTINLIDCINNHLIPDLICHISHTPPGP